LLRCGECFQFRFIDGNNVNEPDLPDTLMVAALREIEQEITIVTQDGHGTAKPRLASDDLRPVGLIVDGSNDVGNLHLGIVHVAYLSQGDVVTVNEPELEALPATKLSELLACGSPIESWSKLLAGELVKRL
jgi:predicted NUDIX family phosphoesterase